MGKSAREYNAIFASHERTGFHDDEVVVDIGSGTSNLSKLPVRKIIQIDPRFRGVNDDGRVLQIPGLLGSDDFDRLTPILKELCPDRVTMSQVLRYIPRDVRRMALMRLLDLLPNGGLFQIFPVTERLTPAVTGIGERSGYDVFMTDAKQKSLGGLLFSTVGANTVLNLEVVADSIGEAARGNMAGELARLAP